MVVAEAAVRLTSVPATKHPFFGSIHVVLSDAFVLSRTDFSDLPSLYNWNAASPVLRYCASIPAVAAANGSTRFVASASAFEATSFAAT